MIRTAPTMMKDGESSLQYRERLIVSAAQILFLEQGYDGANMDNVARASGFTKKTLYNYFPSKERLFFAVFRDLCDELLHDIQHAKEHQSGSPEEALTNLCLRTLEVVSAPQRMEVFRLAIDVAKRFPELGDEMRRATMERIDKELGGLLDSLVSAGHLRIEDTSFATRYLIGMITGVLLSRLLGAADQWDRADRVRFATGAVELFCRGYRP